MARAAVTVVFMVLVLFVGVFAGYMVGTDTDASETTTTTEVSETTTTTAPETTTTTVEDIREPVQYKDLIRVTSLSAGDAIESPLVIKGEARGSWFFEGTFPIVLTDWDGRIIAEGYATAQGEWMTEDYVPFEATLTFTAPDLYPERGYLILQKANASGLPEHDDALEFQISFK